MELHLVVFLAAVIIYIFFLALNISSLIFKTPKIQNNKDNPSVSVVIAIRNGEKSIPNLINCINKQNYQGQFEFILVDDESEDSSKPLILEAVNTNTKIKYASSIEGNNQLSFKKRALDAGIKKSQYDILLFTDVDCSFGNKWVSSMAKKFSDKVDYVVGFSKAKRKYGLANLFQRTDFLILMFSAKAFCDLGYPLASSGQNQGYRKNLFNKIGGYEKIKKLLMGDDSIFLQLCNKLKANIVFNDDKESFVYCRPEKKWIDLFKQRVRWAGDGKIMWRYNFSFYIIMVSTVLSNFFIIFILFTESFDTFYIVFVIKLISELMLQRLGSYRFKISIPITHFIFWYIINIPYVFLMCLGSFFVHHLSWQNRAQK